MLHNTFKMHSLFFYEVERNKHYFETPMHQSDIGNRSKAAFLARKFPYNLLHYLFL